MPIIKNHRLSPAKTYRHFLLSAITLSILGLSACGGSDNITALLGNDQSEQPSSILDF